jgi:type IV pilus assembly protein PilY1
MLHAFNGSATGGQELFGYIPNAVIAKLGTLAKPSYTHTYVVDGTPAIGDAYLGSWKTVLVSSAGAGAPAVFALDVTNPTGFSTSSLLWEFNSTVDPDMGQFTGIPSPPSLTADGKWITAFGNGYNGASKKAKLFVLDLSTGSPITVDAITDSANAVGNGLSTATIVDAQGTCPSGGPAVCSDGVGDTIYAGDYFGNVWKFVLSGSAWRLSPSTPIFKAVDSYGHKQPITSGMFAIKNPVGGVIIFFGTGKYLATADNNPDTVQADGNPLVNSIYGIWDNGSGTAVTRAGLQQQQVVSYASGLWTITQNEFGYKTALYPQGKMGWYLDLTAPGTPDPLKGERVLASPAGLLSKLFVNVFRPVGDICLPAGINSLLELDLLNGSAAFPPPGGGTGGSNGSDPAVGGGDIGNGPPLGSPNPVISIPGQTGIPPIGCDPADPACVPHGQPWCGPLTPGFPNCPDPCWCQAGAPGYPACAPPPTCPVSDPQYPYCKNACPTNCTVIVNPGSTTGNQSMQCRASWRQLR